MVRILVAEDDGALRYDMVEMVASWGYEVRAAAAGLAAFRLMKEWRPHVVLSDINMPHVSGFDLVRYNTTLKSDYADVVFILISAMSARKIVDAALHAGADEYITKPVDYIHLKAKIEEHIDKKRDFLASAARKQRHGI